MKLISAVGYWHLMLWCLVSWHVHAAAPQTAKIVFASTRNGNRDIYLMNPDGSQVVNLTRDFADDLYPVWSPTGEQILFVSDRGGARDLYLMDADGLHVRRVFKKSAHREAPTWSPDGEQIAYERGAAIYIATLRQPIEEHLVLGFRPAWSPDGREIAFVAGMFGDHRLSLFDLQTRRRKWVLPEDVAPWQNHPAWSLTGQQIAFSWNKNPLPVPAGLKAGEPFRVPLAWLEKETVYVVDREGTGVRQIVKEVGPKAVSPVWFPGGVELIYTQEIDNRRHLFKIDLATRVSRQLTHTGQGHLTADWFDPAVLPVSPQPQLLTRTWGEAKKK